MKFGAMKPQRRNRLLVVLMVVVFSGAAVGLSLLALNENINLFYSPVQVVEGDAPESQTIRVGGMVMNGSVERAENSLVVSFQVGDLNGAIVPVEYEGILPGLFREGQGVIAQGQLVNGVFRADEVLAKHDENYMAPEVESVLADAHARGGQDPKTIMAAKETLGGSE